MTGPDGKPERVCPGFGSPPSSLSSWALRRPVGLLVAAGYLVLLGTAGCLPKKPVLVDFSESARDYRSNDYRAVYERWTRHDKVVHALESALEIWATFKSCDFREAFVARYADRYALNDEERERLRTSQREAAARGYEFLITAQSANFRWNDLDRRTSPWRLSLVDGLGREIAPDVVKLEKLPDLFEQEFYPVKTPFTKTYLVRFNRPDDDAGGEKFGGTDTGVLILRVAGPRGHADLTWLGR